MIGESVAAQAPSRKRAQNVYKKGSKRKINSVDPLNRFTV
jgi:hypothetical protein